MATSSALQCIQMGGFVEMWVLMCRCTSELDAILQWPAKVIITLQLLNQLRDNDCMSMTTVWLDGLLNM